MHYQKTKWQLKCSARLHSCLTLKLFFIKFIRVKLYKFVDIVLLKHSLVNSIVIFFTFSAFLLHFCSFLCSLPQHRCLEKDWTSYSVLTRTFIISEWSTRMVTVSVPTHSRATGYANTAYIDLSTCQFNTQSGQFVSQAVISFRKADISFRIVDI